MIYYSQMHGFALIRLLPFFIVLAVDKLSFFGNIGEMNFFGYCALVLSTLLWTLLLLAPSYFLGRRAKPAYLLLFALLFLSCCLQWHMRYSFAMNLDGDWLGILLASSSDEATAFCRGYATWRTLGLCCLGLGVLACGEWALVRSNFDRSPRIGLAACAFVLAVTTAWWYPRYRQNLTLFFEMHPSANFVYDTIRHAGDILRLDQLRRSPQIPHGLARRQASGECPVYVFVLGESATRNRWSLYGYGKRTTPAMDAIRPELCIYSDVIASSSNTSDAMRFLFTDATPERQDNMPCTMSQVLQSLGFRCALYSAQARWGMYDGIESFLFSGCEAIRFVSEDLHCERHYDMRLLSGLDEELAVPNHPLAVFLHLNGSHSPPARSYPPDFAPFPPDDTPDATTGTNPLKTSNHYDNSIAFTDKLLGKIVRRLNQLNRPAALIYISDHGESVNSTHWRNAADSSVWEIPMIIWFSPLFRTAYPETVRAAQRAQNLPLQSERLLPGLLSIYQVDGYGTSEENFMKPTYKAAPRLIRNERLTYERTLE